MLTHKKLTSTERRLLSKWKKEGLSNGECAKRLGRNKATIGRELNRNKVRVTIGRDWQYIYEPTHAQAVSEERKENAWFAKQPLKNKKIYSYVLRQLRKGWSPEQIAGRLKLLHPKDKDWHICHETIYQFIYKPKTELTRKGIKEEIVWDKRRYKNRNNLVTVTDYHRQLWEYLRRKQVKRRKRNGRKVQRARIPDRVSIHDRPKTIDKRKEFGHWEGDSIVGKGHLSGLHTEYERVTSLTRFEKVLRINMEGFIQATDKIFGVLPSKARLSTTLDNGSENIGHVRLKQTYGMATYFADPYSAWQRGGNENANLWIRYYFPKGTDFSTITTEELRDVEKELNNRPRKRLGFKTPKEVFNQYLNLP